MCTVSWRPTDPDGAFELYFNRDESRLRSRALPPRRRPPEHEGELAVLAPIDPDGGGTWLAANERGLVVGILNLYEAEIRHAPDHARSRGRLVLELAADCPSLDSTAERLADLEPRPYRPFLLLVVAWPFAPRLWRWDGASLTDEGIPAPPLTTSSFESASVCAARRDAFARLVGAGDALDAFHLSRDPSDRAHSVFMARPDARTVSVSRIRVAPPTIAFQYRETRDDDSGLGPPVDADLPMAPCRA